VSRLTRVQQQERTHEQLLDAGRSVFLRRGFLAATVEEIAAEAGYTRGAVYKHFGGKEGMWQAIIDARADVLLRGLRDALDRATCHEELVAALNPSGFVHDHEAARWTVVSAEFLAAIAAQPQHAAALVALQRRLDEAVVALLTRHCHRLRIRPAVPLPQLVVAWGALGGGLALLHAVDPATEVATIAASVLAVLFPRPPGSVPG
jgi:AcrR family transcriptional regulator